MNTEPDDGKPGNDAVSDPASSAASRPGKRGPVFRVVLEGSGNPGQDALALRLILKKLGRRFGLRCVGLRQG